MFKFTIPCGTYDLAKEACERIEGLILEQTDEAIVSIYKGYSVIVSTESPQRVFANLTEQGFI